MKSTFTKICFIFLSFIISFGAYGHGTIIFPNVEHGDGFIDVKIYDSKESFLDEDLAIESVRKRVKKGEVVVPLSKIHEGKIAIVAYHDEDSDGKLKTGLFWRPGAGNYDKTIVNALMHYDKNSLSNIGDELRPGIVHRIDKNTSGLVVIAKNNQAHENLSKQFSEHTILREYQLLIWGKLRPSKGQIVTFLTRSSRNRQLMEVSRSKGKKAITNYKTLEIFENEKTPTLSLVECKLETGRTHQIRVHMNYKGNSIVGDDKYKKKYKKLKNIDLKIQNLISDLARQFLHAKTLGFIHPKNNEKMHFSSNLPHELNNILEILRNTNK